MAATVDPTPNGFGGRQTAIVESVRFEQMLGRVGKEFEQNFVPGTF